MRMGSKKTKKGWVTMQCWKCKQEGKTSKKYIGLHHIQGHNKERRGLPENHLRAVLEVVYY